MLWELAVVCQRLLIPPIARQAAGAGGWGVIGGPCLETRRSRHIAHAQEPRPVARTDLPHQSRDAQSPLAPLGDPGLGVLPEAQAGWGHTWGRDGGDLLCPAR